MDAAPPASQPELRRQWLRDIWQRRSEAEANQSRAALTRWYGGDKGAEVKFAVESEAALHLDDVLTRRTRLSIECRDRGVAGAPFVASIMSDLLGWDDATVARELEHYEARVNAERESQMMPDDLTADAARLGAPDIRTLGKELADLLHLAGFGRIVNRSRDGCRAGKDAERDQRQGPETSSHPDSRGIRRASRERTLLGMLTVLKASKNNRLSGYRALNRFLSIL